MAVVTISTLTPKAEVLPRVCVKTGVPTGDVVRVRGRAAQDWAGATILFGLVAWLFVSSLSSRSYDLLVPFRAEAWRRHRTLRTASLATLWSGVVLAVVVGALGGNGGLMLLLTVLGLALLVVNDWRNSFGVRLGRDGGLELTRVHDEFAAAARRSAMRS
ncbi:hypothetical protein [Pedococcus soli]